MRNRHQDHRPHRRGRQRKQKRIIVDNPQPGENPSADHRSNQSQHNVTDTPKTPSPRQFPGQPSCNQPDQQPPNQPALPFHDHHSFLKKRQCTVREHEPPLQLSVDDLQSGPAYSIPGILWSPVRPTLFPQPAPAVSCSAAFPAPAPGHGSVSPQPRAPETISKAYSAPRGHWDH